MVEYDQVLLLCHPGPVDQPETMFPPELSILRRTIPRSGEGAVPGHSSLPFPFGPPEDLPPSLHKHPWENINIEDHQDVLNIDHSLQCEDTKMVVSIEKETLKVSKEYLYVYIITLWIRMESCMICQDVYV